MNPPYLPATKLILSCASHFSLFSWFRTRLAFTACIVLLSLLLFPPTCYHRRGFIQRQTETSMRLQSTAREMAWSPSLLITLYPIRFWTSPVPRLSSVNVRLSSSKHLASASAPRSPILFHPTSCSIPQIPRSSETRVRFFLSAPAIATAPLYPQCLPPIRFVKLLYR